MTSALRDATRICLSRRIGRDDWKCVLGEGRMSTSSSCLLSAGKRRSSLGQAKIFRIRRPCSRCSGCDRLCRYAVQQHLRRQRHPSRTSVQVAVAPRQTSSIARKTPAAMITTVFGDLEQATAAVPKNEAVMAVSVMFNERCAASPESVAPQSSQGMQLPPPRRRSRCRCRPSSTKKTSASASVQIAMCTPATRRVERVTASPGSSIRDMAAQRAKAAVMSIGQDKPSMVEKLWGKEPAHGALLAYASADASITGGIEKSRTRCSAASHLTTSRPRSTSSPRKTVYLPDGTQLEAHSGLGSKMDDPRYSHVRMQGVTPPHIYDLTPREAAVPRRAGAAAQSDRRRGQDLRPRRSARAHLHARRHRPVQRLRVLQGLLRLPRCLQDQGHPAGLR